MSVHSHGNSISLEQTWHGGRQTEQRSERRTLWIVLASQHRAGNRFLRDSGAFGDSSALIANGLDNLSDSFVYAISLFALSRSAKWKCGAANVSGGLLILFALGHPL